MLTFREGRIVHPNRAVRDPGDRAARVVYQQADDVSADS